MQGDGMNKGSGMSVWMRGLLIMLFAVMCHAGAANALTADQTADANTAQIMTDTNIATTCDNEAVRDQQLGLGAYKQRVEEELTDTSRDGAITDFAEQVNKTLGDAYFCPVKITGIVDIVDMASTIAGGIMGVVVAAITAFVKGIIVGLLKAACNALIGAINGVLSAICIPAVNFSLNLKVPDFSFGGKGNKCAGTPLAVLTGGPSLPTPPSNYGLSIPAVKFDGRVNVIQ
jgi:hypothetical protein